MDDYGGNYEAVARGEAPPNVNNSETSEQRPSNNTDGNSVNESQPEERRGSMTLDEERERRASIRAIMADTSISPMERRRSIQALMDGRRNSASRRASMEKVSNTVISVNGHVGQTTLIELSKKMELSRPKCNHYKRNCTIIAPCCGAAFGCRICHDECPVLPPPKYGEPKGGKVKRRYPRSGSLPASLSDIPEPEHHEIDRFKIREVICRKCYTRQSSKRNECIKCLEPFGEYHCEICNLWMSDEEEPYHCPDCGFCRVGGRDNFKHCQDCGMCIDSSLFDSHNCKSGKYMSNCPVCQEDLFSSRHASHEMPCGHTIHWHCYQEFSKHDSRCPVCKKTSETPENMAATWQALALSIKLQPVPVELAKVVNITCNDCETADNNLRWHFLGVQCRNCNSFNTNIEQITLTGRQAVLFADQMESLRRQMEQGGFSSNHSEVESVGEIMHGSASSVNSTPYASQRASFTDTGMDLDEDGSQLTPRSPPLRRTGDNLIVDFDPAQRRRVSQRNLYETSADDDDESMN